MTKKMQDIATDDITENEGNTLTQGEVDIVDIPISTVVEYYGDKSTIENSNNWKIANGCLLPKDEYSELYNIIGGMFGENETHFRIVDKRSRVGIGAIDDEDLSKYEGDNEVLFLNTESPVLSADYLNNSTNINGIATIYPPRELAHKNTSLNVVHCHYIMKVR